ncbi:PLP-dependent aminotransferase family protein [Phytohabitans flavus]|uniref:GntR family transcriptional regulator n=1 Tax=Phytohabitans flavus TaxID=1076124 RepID=A0A6F8Y5Z5_9ACTN|nr:PLP-dependent aminotransferase family protein [Phytohabitans flavus]BCB81536.1 GntR family transcriptional regulator [Phytohabitans flavus]
MWEALVQLDRSRPGLADQLINAVRDAIADGRLAPGTRLPSSRALARDLTLSRGVVVEAYEQLVAEGRLLSRQGAGTVVAGLIRETVERRAAEPPDQVPDQPSTLLRPGVPDFGMFPRAAWRRVYERTLALMADAVLDYGDPSGAVRLRSELASYLGRVRGARVEPGHVVVTTGAAQGFAVLAAALRAGGVTAIGFEEPGSYGVRGHLESHGLRLVPVPVDADGLDVAALERSAAPAVFVTPAHQFPTGVVLAPARRAALVEWARRTGGLIVEDDYDAEFRYDRDPVGCLQGLAPDAVAYIGSVSKALAPALRLGWLAVPEKWRDAVAERKAWADLGGPVLEQLAFAELLASGGYDRHLRRTRLEHRRRRDALVAALRRHLPGLRISGVAAGLHLVLELPEGVDDEALAERARALGLGPLPLSRMRLAGFGPPGLVLGYAANSPGELETGVKQLASVYGAVRTAR